MGRKTKQCNSQDFIPVSASLFCLVFFFFLKSLNFMGTGPLSQLRCWSMSSVWRIGTATVPGNRSTQKVGERRPNPFSRDDSAAWGSPQGLLPWEEARSRRLLCVTGGRAVSAARAYDSWAWATSWPVRLRLPLTFTNSGAFSCSSCNFCFSSSS